MRVKVWFQAHPELLINAVHVNERQHSTWKASKHVGPATETQQHYTPPVELDHNGVSQCSRSFQMHNIQGNSQGQQPKPKTNKVLVTQPHLWNLTT
jgi:hypothetical protein